jgi:hypothetical protein
MVRDEVETPHGVSVSAEYLRKLAQSIDYKISQRSDLRVLAPAVDLLTVDLRTVEAEPLYNGLRATWKLRELSKANAILLWARSVLHDNIELDTWDTSHWQPAALPFEPFSTKSGDLSFSINMASSQFNWSVSAGAETQRSYFPLLASAKIQSDMQFNPRRSMMRTVRK